MKGARVFSAIVLLVLLASCSAPMDTPMPLGLDGVALGASRSQTLAVRDNARVNQSDRHVSEDVEILDGKFALVTYFFESRWRLASVDIQFDVPELADEGLAAPLVLGAILDQAVGIWGEPTQVNRLERRFEKIALMWAKDGYFVTLRMCPPEVIATAEHPQDPVGAYLSVSVPDVFEHRYARSEFGVEYDQAAWEQVSQWLSSSRAAGVRL